MTFIELPYGLFLAVVLGCYWLLRPRHPPKEEIATPHSPTTTPHLPQLWVLTIASVGFYLLLQIQGDRASTSLVAIAYLNIVLLGAIAYLNFYLGQAIARQTQQNNQPQHAKLSNQDWEQMQQVWNQRATQLLILGITLNVLLLVGFKYIPFLLETLAALLNWPEAMAAATGVRSHLIPPLGISFFTFECIAYLVDVYRGAPITRSFLDFASYKFFFPKLIAGPIVRYHPFAAQFQNQPLPRLNQITQGLWLIASGAVKKALIADHLGIFVDLCFGNLERAGSGDLWLAIFAYGLQLYFDFSGYVDLARGSALLLGFNLPENFNAPYFAVSIADFWRRWHITLGSWLRNYLYFPLGGSRQGLARTCLNLFLVMAIAGIWHGAAWGYVIWGILHGIALAIHRLTEALSQEVEPLAKFWQSVPGVVLAWAMTQFMVFGTWIFFRLPSVDRSGLLLQHLWHYEGDIQFVQKVYIEALGLERFALTAIAIAIALSMAFTHLCQNSLKLQLNWPVKIILIPLSLYIVWLYAPQGGLQYIYFDF
ncbi:MAG: MBOAT family protein [Jaaginema sp. PMC 1079.18]|nr:MBOAT family protein [Jaaginema sp. PMC 1080.18]MEC4853641.1 MBOAT family protein [Jaaginema sp. PMC 1079.18]MEC4868968.1 MBOAT family protein [Jaaginema sp. PMC 1078.18]